MPCNSGELANATHYAEISKMCSIEEERDRKGKKMGRQKNRGVDNFSCFSSGWIMHFDISVLFTIMDSSKHLNVDKLPQKVGARAYLTNTGAGYLSSSSDDDGETVLVSPSMADAYRPQKPRKTSYKQYRFAVNFEILRQTQRITVRSFIIVLL